MPGDILRNPRRKRHVVRPQRAMHRPLSGAQPLVQLRVHVADLVLKGDDALLEGSQLVEQGELGVDGGEEVLDLVVALLVHLVVARDGAVDGGELVVGALEAVVQVLELGLGGLEGVCVLVGDLFEVLGVGGHLLLAAVGKLGAAVGVAAGIFVSVVVSIVVIVIVVIIVVVVVVAARVEVVAGGVRSHNHLEDLKRVGAVWCRRSDAHKVALWQAHFARLKACLAVNLNPEAVAPLAQLDLRRPAQVAVAKLAVAKRQRVDIVMLREIGRAVVEEAAQHAALAAVRVNDQHQAVEAASIIDAAGAQVLAIAGHPDVEVAARSVGAAGAKVDVDDPVGVDQRVLAPDGAARIAWRNGGEDDLAGEDLWHAGLARDGEVGDVAWVVGRAYPGRRRDALAAIVIVSKQLAQNQTQDKTKQKHTALHIQN